MFRSLSDPNILYVIGHLGRGGAEQQLYYLLKYLKPQATVLSLSQNGYWAGPIRKLGLKVVELNRVGHADLTRLWALIRFIRTQRPDIIHIFIDGSSGIYGRLAALIKRHPCVIVGERCHPSLDPAWYTLIKRFWLNRHVSVIVSNSTCSKNYLMIHDKLPPEKVKCIPNSVEMDSFVVNGPPNRKAMLPESWREKLVIGTVGSLEPRKAPETFIGVARRVVEKCSDARFLHIGDGPLRGKVRSLCLTLGVEEFVNFLGLRHDVPELLRTMDIFVLTSHKEGMSNSVMEAMAVGLPCVVTDAGDCRELVHDGETGFVVPIGDEKQLADRILHLVADEQLRLVMGEKARTRSRLYDVYTMAEQYQDLYQHALSSSISRS